MPRPKPRPSNSAKRTALRKRRTREHVIADLGVNHVERYALRCGCSVERARSDYGLDLTLFTYNRRGEIENGVIYVQVKATDRIRLARGHDRIVFSISRADLMYWLAEKQPVILVLYDAKKDEAFWLYVQAYFEALSGFRLSDIGQTTTVLIEQRNRVGEEAIRRFIRFRDSCERQQSGKITHHV
jgi:hypothetical protein